MLLVVLPILSSSASAANPEKDEDRLRNSGTVLKEILDVPDDIPQDLLDKADCVVVFPSVRKAAFIVGGSYGRGAMSCRRGEEFRGSWGTPTMMALEGGSFGLQIGGEATDFVLLVMNERGASGILSVAVLHKNVLRTSGRSCGEQSSRSTGRETRRLRSAGRTRRRISTPAGPPQREFCLALAFSPAGETLPSYLTDEPGSHSKSRDANPWASSGQALGHRLQVRTRDSTYISASA